MEARDIIFYSPADENKFQEAVRQTFLSYLVSFPFNVAIPAAESLSEHFKFYFHSAVAKLIFKLYAEERGHPVEFSQEKITFWQRPKYDFRIGQSEFFLINNSVRKSDLLQPEKYLKLPALVPNQFGDDLWSKRKKSDGTIRGFIFTFMTGKNYCDYTLTPETIQFLWRINRKYGDYNGSEPPFSESDFWKELNKKTVVPEIHMIDKPTLIISGIAQAAEFSFFADTDDKTHHAYRLYSGLWYQINKAGGLDFCDGLIHTNIRNATCPVVALPSVKNYFS